MTQKKIASIGIDPGWKNLGLAVVTPTEKGKVKVLGSLTLNPSLGDLAFVESLPIIINTLIPSTLDYDIQHLVIERYAPYNNVHSSESENITMLIGMIRSKLYSQNACVEQGLSAKLYRAIDWKVKMAQVNSRLYGFSNKSTCLDKNYSLQMAHFITENPNPNSSTTLTLNKDTQIETVTKIKTDHEADAICLAALPFFYEENPQRKDGKTRCN